ARELEPVVSDLCAVLGLEVGFRDPGVAEFGLTNAVLPLGTTFIEVVSPARADAAAARFLERHGGDGGYMVLVQTADLAADRRRLASLGVRIVWQGALDDIAARHPPPRAVGGASCSSHRPRPPRPGRVGGGGGVGGTGRRKRAPTWCATSPASRSTGRIRRRSPRGGRPCSACRLRCRPETGSSSRSTRARSASSERTVTRASRRSVSRR